MAYVFKRSGEWAGYSVRETAKGYTVEFWSAVQGGTSGYKALVPFSTRHPKGMNLDAEWNDFCSTGEHLADAAYGPEARTLRTGVRAR